MDKVTEEYIYKTADLAKIKIEASEISKFQKQLGDILTEIDKINNIEINNSKALVNPTINENDYNEKETTLLSKEEVLQAAKNKDEDYVVVPKVV